MPTTLQQLVTDHVHALRSAGHRHKRIADSRRQLDLFTTWAEIAGVTQLDQLSLDVIDAYHEHLLLLRNDNGYSLNLMVQRETSGQAAAVVELASYARLAQHRLVSRRTDSQASSSAQLLKANAPTTPNLSGSKRTFRVAFGHLSDRRIASKLFHHKR